MLKLICYITLSFFLFFNSFAKNVDEIEILGNKRISKESIILLGSIDTLNNYNEEIINDLLKRLYETGFFKDIDISFYQKKLIINVIENPIIEEINLNGIKNKNLISSILENISLKKRSSFTNDKLQKDINLIENFLKRNGYYFSNISTGVSKNDALNSITINFNIELGNKAKIKQISFIGNKVFKEKKLIEAIASEEHKFWKFLSNKVYLNESTINLDKRLLENFYKNRGYYKVEVLSSFVEFDKNGNFILKFNIDSGNQYYFNELELNLPIDYDDKYFDKLENIFSNIKGELYSLDNLSLILDEIEKIASGRLYEFIDVNVEEKIVDNKINLKFNVQDTDRLYVEKINIFGNFQTEEEVIRNKLILDEGDPLNKLLYNKTIDNIKSLRIFKSVNAEVKDGSEFNKKIIDLTVEEQPTGEISLTAGLGTTGGSIGAGLTEKNFLGKGINLNTNFLISDDSIKGQFIYSKPNFAYTDNTLSTSLIATTTDLLTTSGYKSSIISSSIGTEFEQYENLSFSPAISFSIEDLETNSTASKQLKKQNGEYQDLFFNYGLNYDLRNSKFNPSDGEQYYFEQQLPIVSEDYELSNTFIFTKYHNLNKASNMIGKTSLYFKAINSINDSDVRLSKRLYVPYNRLRGFEKGKVGPVDNTDYIGGNYVSTLNLSTNLPSILPTVENLDFNYFVDVANIWGVDYDKSIDDSSKFRSSTGLGVDFLTPVGPLSFSFTKPITKQSSDKTESFRFNLGTTF